MDVVTLRIPADLAAKIADLATREGEHGSVIMRRALRQYIHRRLRGPSTVTSTHPKGQRP
jgi:predicted transcriptional regulator